MAVKYTKKQIIKFIIKILLVAAAGLVGGATFKSFFEAIDVVPTGMSGFAMLISTWLELAGVNISTSIIYLIINVVLFALSLKFMGWKFLVLSGVGLGSYVLGMEFGLIEILAQGAANDTLLYVLVGSMLSGLCVGLAMRLGGSTGGSDIMGTLCNRAFPKIKTGYCILAINVVVLALSIITTGATRGLESGLQNGLYALVIAVLSSIATNMVLDKSKKIVAFNIICDKPEEVADAIMKHYGRGVTRMEGMGMFTHNDKAVLLCLVPYDQSYKMREFVLKIDPNAFVYSTPVTETIGEKKLLKIKDLDDLAMTSENQTKNKTQDKEEKPEEQTKIIADTQPVEVAATKEKAEIKQTKSRKTSQKKTATKKAAPGATAKKQPEKPAAKKSPTKKTTTKKSTTKKDV